MGTARQSPPSPELKIFGERLTKAIEFKKIDISALAKEFKCSPSDIKKMMNGMREPSMTKLITIADTLGCSSDYLLGLSLEAQRAAVVVSADTDAIKLKQSEHRQTSGQISGKTGQFLAIIPELLEADIDLLMHIAGFLIERKAKGMTRLMEAVATDSKGKPKPSEFGELSDDDFKDDDLWDEVEDDEFEDDDLNEDEDEDFEDDFDEDDFD
jgi:transcriptional regulator with XRE-family HTH domain